MMNTHFVRTILAFLLCLTSFTEGAAYGGTGGSPHTFMCQGNNFIQSVAFKSGLELDAISFKCNNENWSIWYGGNGGSLHNYHATAAGFCGMWGKSGALIDRLCLQDANGAAQCFGGNGGGDFVDRTCATSPGNGRMRLKGFHLRSGLRVDRLEPIWDIRDCNNYITIGQAPWSYWNGQYQFDSWKNGHHMYRKVDAANDGHNRCIFYGDHHWRFLQCDQIESHPTYAHNYIANWDAYDYCVGNLGGSNHWKNSNQNIYPPLQISGEDELAVTWGNAVGYWSFKQAGQGYGDTSTFTVTRYTESTSGQEFTDEQESSFASSSSLSQTHSVEVGVNGEFYGMGVESKYTHATEMTESTENSVRANTIEALSVATTSGTSTTLECTTSMPNALYVTWVWTVYRASSIENSAQAQETCTFQHQSGACKDVPPNCPIGKCQDEQCIYCSSGTMPLTKFYSLRAQYPACFEYLEGGESRCHPELNDWDCCSESNPCLAGEGDCDNDNQCMGSLVCIHDPNPNSIFDYCGYPDTAASSGRRLLDLVDTEDHVSIVEEHVFADRTHTAASGCGQFDDKGHCRSGPLYKFCKWSEAEHSCVLKENVDVSKMPTNDFTWIYDL
jgi:hypothetical protein